MTCPLAHKNEINLSVSQTNKVVVMWNNYDLSLLFFSVLLWSFDMFGGLVLSFKYQPCYR